VGFLVRQLAVLLQLLTEHSERLSPFLLVGVLVELRVRHQGVSKVLVVQLLVAPLTQTATVRAVL